MRQLAPAPIPVQGLNGITCRATIRGAWLSLAGGVSSSGWGGGVPGGSALRALCWGAAVLSRLGRVQLRCCCWARGARLGGALAPDGGAARPVIAAAAAAAAARAR